MSANQKISTNYSHDPDVQLMLRVRNGDDAAFEQLVAGYQDRLIAVFFHMLGNRTVAEDLTQDVFLRVYRARERYKPTAKFSTWLFRIANNLASNKRRRAGYAREVPLTVNDSQAPEPATRDRELAENSALMPTRQLDHRELRDHVKQALESLNDRQRMAVLLSKFEGMCYADISDSMGLSQQAVKSLLSRARENLKTKLEGYIEI